MESFDYLKSFYEAKDEDARLLTKRGNVEFQTTVRYIEKYLKRGMRVLEIGAGTGRYSHYFARRGYAVDAVELIPHNVELFKEHTASGENVTVSQGDARDLSRYPDETFDITLSLGPMYHLYTAADKEKAMAEAIRVTKKGGLLFVAYCMNEPTIVQYCFVKNQWKPTMERGMLDADFHCLSSPAEIFELYRTEDILALTAGLPVERLHLVATDLFTHYIPLAVENMDEETYAQYLRYHFAVCERADLLGVSNHTLDVLQKR